MGWSWEEATAKGQTTRTGKGADRVRWAYYDEIERAVLDRKLLGDSEGLGFLDDFWNVARDQRDTREFGKLARVWQLRTQGMSYGQISLAIRPESANPGQLASGYNRRPNLSQMYLNHEMLRTRPKKDGWKWVLETTPKPTDPYPAATSVPPQIQSHTDILDFLKQFLPVSESNPNLSFFGVTSTWLETSKPELFYFLLGFLVGDGGKYYSEYESRARHYRKAAVTTNMKRTGSNYRVLRYVQLALDCIGIRSHEIQDQTTLEGDQVIRWNSVHSNLVTWLIRVCLGLKEGQRTSKHPVSMEWIYDSPRECIAAFLQGVADSDGHVPKTRNYAELSSIPNTIFYKKLIRRLGFEATTYPRDDPHPKVLRVSSTTAANIPLFNPIIQSYRYDELQNKI